MMLFCWKLAKLGVIGLLLFGMGRFVGAACTRECDDIEAYRETAAICRVFATLVDESTPNAKPTVKLRCSRGGATNYWVDSGFNAECDDVGVNATALYECPLSHCDDLCPTKNFNKEMDYNKDDDAMMEGEQIDTSKCTKLNWPALSDKFCDVSPPNSGQ